MQKAALVLALSAPATAFMPASVKRSAVAAKGTADPWFPDTILDFDPAVSAKTGPVKSGKQDFLEASPYFDQANIPINTFKAKVRAGARLLPPLLLLVCP